MKIVGTFKNIQEFKLTLSNILSFKKNSVLDRLNVSKNVLFRENLFQITLRFINNYQLFSSFVSQNLTIIKNSLLVGFVELDLIGLGFRIRKLSSELYRFFFGKANYIYIFVKSPIIFRSYSNDSTKIRRIYILGQNISLVNNLSASILLLQPLNSYRVTGVVDPRKVVVLRSGKQR